MKIFFFAIEFGLVVGSVIMVRSDVRICLLLDVMLSDCRNACGYSYVINRVSSRHPIQSLS